MTAFSKWAVVNISLSGQLCRLQRAIMPYTQSRKSTDTERTYLPDYKAELAGLMKQFLAAHQSIGLDIIGLRLYYKN